MSNRQARREESRTTRTPRQRTNRTPAGRPQPRKPSGPSSSGPSFLSRPYLLGLAALIIALAAVLVFLAVSRNSGTSNVGSGLFALEANFPYDLAKGTTVGKADAPLKLVEFEDFQCPFCLRHTGNIEPKLVDEYVRTGKMSITYKNLPLLGFESTIAARAGVCAAEQDKFWQFHNQLFKKEADAGQDVGEKLNVGRFSEAAVKDIATSLGMDATKFSDCYGDNKSLQAVQDQTREAQTLGMSGTPSFLLNGQSIGSGTLALEDFRKTLNSAYDRLTGSPTPGAAGSASPSASASAAVSPAAATPTPAASATSPTAVPTR